MFDSSGVIHQIPPSPVRRPVVRPLQSLVQRLRLHTVVVTAVVLANPPTRRIQPPGPEAASRLGPPADGVVGNSVQHVREDSIGAGSAAWNGAPHAVPPAESAAAPPPGVGFVAVPEENGEGYNDHVGRRKSGQTLRTEQFRFCGAG